MIWFDWISGRYFLTMNAGSANYLDSGQQPAVGAVAAPRARRTTAPPRASSSTARRSRASRLHRRTSATPTTGGSARTAAKSLRVLRRPHRRGPDLRPCALRVHRSRPTWQRPVAAAPGAWSATTPGERRDERRTRRRRSGPPSTRRCRASTRQHDDRAAARRLGLARPGDRLLHRRPRQGHAHAGQRRADLWRDVHRDGQGRRRPVSRAPAAARWPSDRAWSFTVDPRTADPARRPRPRSPFSSYAGGDPEDRGPVRVHDARRLAHLTVAS